MMSFFDEGRHIWFIEDEEEIFNSEWFKENTPAKQKMIKENIEKFITNYEYERNYYLSIPLYKIDDIEEQSEAKKILQAPLHILTEGNSDRVFLEKVIDIFAKSKNVFAINIQNALQDGWAIIVGGGGNTWEKEMNNYFSKYGKYRIFVFADSDKLYPTHESDKKESVEKPCKRKGISFHVLYKREIENYLPLKALEVFAKEINKTSVYLEFEKLGLDERDFYDLENGFKAGEDRNFLSIQQENELFKNLGQDQTSRLENGFGNKSKIISYFNDTINAKDLIEHCKHHPILAHQNPQGEMAEILSKIAKAL